MIVKVFSFKNLLIFLCAVSPFASFGNDISRLAQGYFEQPMLFAQNSSSAAQRRQKQITNRGRFVERKAAAIRKKRRSSTFKNKLNSTLMEVSQRKPEAPKGDILVITPQFGDQPIVDQNVVKVAFEAVSFEAIQKISVNNDPIPLAESVTWTSFNYRIVLKQEEAKVYKVTVETERYMQDFDFLFRRKKASADQKEDENKKPKNWDILLGVGAEQHSNINGALKDKTEDLNSEEPQMAAASKALLKMDFRWDLWLQQEVSLLALQRQFSKEEAQPYDFIYYQFQYSFQKMKTGSLSWDLDFGYLSVEQGKSQEKQTNSETFVANSVKGTVLKHQWKVQTRYAQQGFESEEEVSEKNDRAGDKSTVSLQWAFPPTKTNFRTTLQSSYTSKNAKGKLEKQNTATLKASLDFPLPFQNYAQASLSYLESNYLEKKNVLEDPVKDDSLTLELANTYLFSDNFIFLVGASQTSKGTNLTLSGERKESESTLLRFDVIYRF